MVAVYSRPSRACRPCGSGPWHSRRPQAYERRRPEKTPLHRIVARHLETWLATRSLRDRPVATHVEAELRTFLDEIERLLADLAGRGRDGEPLPSARRRLGTVSFLHRFGSALNRHVHLHVCATDGDFSATPDGVTTAARAFQADRELLSATKLILDTKHPSFRNVARVRSEASGYWRTETLPFPEPGVRLLPQNKLTGFDARMSQFRQELLDAARELSGQYEQIKSEARRRLGSLFNPSDYPTTLDGMFVSAHHRHPLCGADVGRRRSLSAP